MTTDEWYRFFLSFFYPIFYGACIILQSTLFYIIFFHSPKNMSLMRYFIGNTCIFQIILVSSTCFAQFRMVSDQVPVEIRAYGPCRHFPALVGFLFFETLQTCTLTSHMSIMATFYLKFEAVRSLNLKTRKIKVILFLIHLPVFTSLIAEAITVFVAQLPEEERMYYAELNKNTTVYAVVGSGMKTKASIINVAIISVTAFSSPIVAFFLRRSIISHITSHLDRSSHMKKLHNRLFVKVLTIQVITPLICFTFIFLIYFYCMATHDVIIFHQYFMCIAVALPSFCDPCVALWFVAPYRRKLKTWLRIEKPSTVAVGQDSFG